MERRMILLTVDSSSETPIYLQIMDQIRARVRDRALTPGAALPPVRRLAGDLEVNPNTVAKAYALLEHEGVLLTRSRRGVFVAEGGPGLAADAADRRLEGAIQRVIEEGRSLGLSRSEMLEALTRRLGTSGSSGGDSS